MVEGEQVDEVSEEVALEAVDSGTSQERRYWKISPGSRGSDWARFRDEGVIGIAFDAPWDLKELAPTNDEDIDVVLRSRGATPHQAGTRSRQLWSFYGAMRPGDLVLAYGLAQVLGWGEVVGEYEYVDDGSWLLHRRAVRWRSTKPRSTVAFPTELRGKLERRATMVQLSQSEFEHAVGPEPNVWLFQANPRNFDLARILAATRQGGEDRWAVMLYREEMRKGDIVLLWQSGPDAGVHAIGELLDAPHARDWPVNEREVGTAQYKMADWWVRFRYTRIFQRPIRRAAFLQNPVLRESHIIRAPMGTNFRVTQEEWEELQKMLDTEASGDVRHILATALQSASLRFTPWQVATYYTALQVKGFVILSGISGTGKTKLAQFFAELLPQPQGAILAPTDDRVLLTVRPYMLKQRSIVIPKRLRRGLQRPETVAHRDVLVYFDGRSQPTRLYHSVTGDVEYMELGLREGAGEWFRRQFSEGDVFELEPEIDEERNLAGFHIRTAAEIRAASQGDAPPGENLLFVPVRPDWRDSKSLLGYYNPLTQTYEWTEFLRFLQRAERSYRDRDGYAWFVILDEMNVARVEYYFADLLSVLESGRSEEGDLKGLTREPLRLTYPEDAEGDVPPSEMRLPPNLYIVGTVNVDETTHAFSPKVLDRSFTLELTEADFSDYPPRANGAAGGRPTEEECRGVLRAFTRDGSFERVEKGAIVEYVAAHPEVRDRLQRLNELLRPYDMHFGYRVFDEIVTFLAAAEQNEMFAGPDPAGDPLDAAVLMKVLPKFHGSRGKLLDPLRDLLAWCVDPDAPAHDQVRSALDKVEGGNNLHAQLSGLPPCRLPYTGARIERMLRALYTDGFAAFG